MSAAAADQWPASASATLSERACSSAEEQRPSKPWVGGSNPPRRMGSGSLSTASTHSLRNRLLASAVVSSDVVGDPTGGGDVHRTWHLAADRSDRSAGRLRVLERPPQAADVCRPSGGVSGPGRSRTSARGFEVRRSSAELRGHDFSVTDQFSGSRRVAGGASPEGTVLRGTGLESDVPSAARGAHRRPAPPAAGARRPGTREGWRTGLEPATTGTTTRGSTN